MSPSAVLGYDVLNDLGGGGGVIFFFLCCLLLLFLLIPGMWLSAAVLHGCETGVPGDPQGPGQVLSSVYQPFFLARSS